MLSTGANCYLKLQGFFWQVAWGSSHDYWPVVDLGGLWGWGRKKRGATIKATARDAFLSDQQQQRAHTQPARHSSSSSYRKGRRFETKNEMKRGADGQGPVQDEPTHRRPTLLSSFLLALFTVARRPLKFLSPCGQRTRHTYEQTHMNISYCNKARLLPPPATFGDLRRVDRYLCQKC